MMDRQFMSKDSGARHPDIGKPNPGPTSKVGKVLGEYKRGTLRSGAPGPGKGPTVTSRKQAIAIGLSEARRAGEIPKR